MHTHLPDDFESGLAALDHFAFAFSPISTKRRDRLIHFHT